MLAAVSPTGPYLEIEGFKDGIVDGSLIGWVWDEFDPAATIDVSISHNGAVLATLKADQFRADLRDAGKGDGRHAFSFLLPTALKEANISDFRVQVVGADVELFEGPSRYRMPNAAIPMPPDALLRATGHSSAEQFRIHGEDVSIVCRKYGRLRSYGKVLDMGCGAGRLAIPLTVYLSKGGSYEGVDIMADVIDWCRTHISTSHPNFRFGHAYVFSKYYNPSGTTIAAEYVFPFESDTFELAFLGSVFTHLLPLELENYLSEIHRVLKPGGRCLISYFLLENGSLKDPTEKSSDANFQYDRGGFRTTNRDVPEAAVAYEEAWVRDVYDRHGFSIQEPIHYGAQDLIVAEKLD